MEQKKIFKLLKLCVELSFPKTIYFNLKYFPLKTALHLPVFVYRRTSLYKMKGSIALKCPPQTGCVRIGSHGIGTQDIRYSRTIWDVSGTLVINGKCHLGRGSRISIGKNGILTIGNKFSLSGDSAIICHKEIVFGDNCLLSWDILIMDTDFHHILNHSGEIINAPCPIHIGNHVWIGCRSTILKGVTIPDDVVISASSTITKSLSEKHIIIGGIGHNVSILKRDVSWKD